MRKLAALVAYMEEKKSNVEAVAAIVPLQLATDYRDVPEEAYYEVAVS